MDFFKLNFFDRVIGVYRQLFNRSGGPVSSIFAGRMTRRDFWMYMLAQLVFELIAAAVAAIPYVGWVVGGLFWTVLALVTLIPDLVMSVRRLHDAGLPGPVAVVWYLVPLVAIILWVLPSSQGVNSYGPPVQSLPNGLPGFPGNQAQQPGYPPQQQPGYPPQQQPGYPPQQQPDYPPQQSASGSSTQWTSPGGGSPGSGSGNPTA
ncbi:MAG: DUF805 domain-containing protein [Deltaproteobacteria bacterium]|jgi:uncharacterized membrane protein YhaH (DUF805 family)|nr:DUF805 domain-containing protein [Deltaproteobacteria bacterium]